MAPHNALLLNINPFDGDPGLLNFFFEQINDLKSCNKWSEIQTIAFLKTKLSGVALRYFIESSAFRSANSVEEIKQLFSSFFRSDSNVVAEQQLANFKLLPGETIRNLAHRLNVLIARVYPTISDVTALNAIKKNKFLESIPVNIRVKLLEYNIDSYDETVAKAQHLQDIFAQSALLQGESSSQPFAEISAQINSLQSQIKDLNVNNSSDNNSQSAARQHNSRSNYHAYHNNNSYVRTNRYNHNYNSWQPRQRSNFSHHSGNNQFTRGNYRRNNSNSFPNVRNVQSQNTRQNCLFCGNQGHLMINCNQFRRLVQPVSSVNNNNSVPNYGSTFDTNTQSHNLNL